MSSTQSKFRGNIVSRACSYTLLVIDRVIFVYKWYLPTLSEIIALAEPDWVAPSGFPAEQQIKAERQWSGAIAALNQLLQRGAERSAVANRSNGATANALEGVLLSGPFPVLNQSDLANRIATWMFTVAAPGEILQLLPSAEDEAFSRYSKVLTLPLLPRDPLAGEQFCLALTSEFSLAMVLGETAEGTPAFLFSFDPEVSWQVWRSLEARIKLAAPHMLTVLKRTIDQFPPVVPDYRTVAQFSRLMLTHLPQPSDLEGKHELPPENPVFQAAGKSFVSLRSPGATATDEPPPIGKSQAGKGKTSHTKGIAPEQRREGEERAAASEPSADAELLQAIAHEVRTPLTTIRTLTRLLLRRKDLNPDVIKRLEVIDRECTEQIDRFNLFFRAVEIETTSARTLWTSLAPISLDQVLQQNIPRWQQQASQHSHTLDIMLPQKMPLVVTDPTMLDQALTGLIDRITHSLPPGSHIQVRVSLAGHQLKLQLESHPQLRDGTDGGKNSKFGLTPTLKSLGQLLMFQPETGNISLNLTATKNLFQALGGKLIVRQRPEEGEVLTIFLPLENRKE